MATYNTTPIQEPLQFHAYSKCSGSSVSNSTPKSNNNQNQSKILEDLTHNCGKKVDFVFSAKDLQCDKDIADYLDYLIRPININDSYVEMCQYHCEFDYYVGKQVPGTDPSTSPTRRTNNRDKKGLKFVEFKGLGAIKRSPYSEYDMLKDFDSNCNIKEAPVPVFESKDGFDVHRTLTQSQTKMNPNGNEQSTKNLKHKIKRNLNFLEALRRKEEGPLLKHFFAFRPPKKNQSGRRRKRFVQGEELVEDHIWPTPRTFDKSNSSGSIASYV